VITPSYDKDDYALQSRHAVTPDECTADNKCWVVLGGAKNLHMGVKGTGGSPRCVACGGLLQLGRWRTPEQMNLPTYGGRVGRNKGGKP
jgi:hypothetical protein